MQKYSATGISFPNEVLARIDAERGDTSRSKYILRQLEKAIQTGKSSRHNLWPKVPTQFILNQVYFAQGQVA